MSTMFQHRHYVKIAQIIASMPVEILGLAALAAGLIFNLM